MYNVHRYVCVNNPATLQHIITSVIRIKVTIIQYTYWYVNVLHVITLYHEHIR